jgi:hypothetical protein
MDVEFVLIIIQDRTQLVIEWLINKILKRYVELSLTMYKNITALISDAQPLLATQVLQLQLITGYVLLLTKSLTDC